MSSSAFFVGLVVVIGLVLAVFVTPILLIPAVLFVLVILVAAPVMAWAGRRMTEGAPPSPQGTHDAAYDPVDRPHGVIPRGS